jgi:peroxiredoxin
MIRTNHLLASLAAAAALLLPAGAAEIGKPAPDFSTKDATGKELSLAGLKGKVVVLEWVNHGCPFVKKHYGAGNMQKLQESYAAKGVVWITVSSAAKGSGGYLAPAEFLKQSADKGSKAGHLVVDESGTIGKAYGAKVTPHLFVINQEGVLVYDGAIDSKKSTEASDIAGAENYVAKALDAVLEGMPVEKSRTEPYGCGVKY